LGIIDYEIEIDTLKDEIYKLKMQDNKYEEYKELKKKYQALKLMLEAKDMVIKDKNDIILNLKSELYDKNKIIQLLVNGEKSK
jgi:hypothetical protein